jgi:hypothetical protein
MNNWAGEGKRENVLIALKGGIWLNVNYYFDVVDGILSIF